MKQPRLQTPVLRTPTIILSAGGLTEARDCREKRARLRWTKLPCGTADRRTRQERCQVAGQ